MEDVIINNNDILILLLDEENEDNIIFSELISTKRNSIDKIFNFYASEKIFKILINRHLKIF